jgi:Leucine-rich repeat (LRR) protein
MAPPNILTLEMVQKRVKGNRMDLSSLRLEQIPLELICRCVTRGIRITEIDLSNNLLTTLTQHFCIFFPEIEVLEMRRNQLKKLPDNFGNLTSLRRLNLENNKIKVIQKYSKTLFDLFFRDFPTVLPISYSWNGLTSQTIRWTVIWLRLSALVPTMFDVPKRP